MIIDLAARREIVELKKRIASLEWQLAYFIAKWSASETAEIEAKLKLEDLGIPQDLGIARG